jgi:hypothetical protein
MPHRLIAGIAGVVLLAAGCGGTDSTATKTTTTLSASRMADLRDASLEAVGDIAHYCYEAQAGGSPDRRHVTDAVDRLADAYRSSRWASSVRADVRQGAQVLRTCDEEGQAARLDGLADDH